MGFKEFRTITLGEVCEGDLQTGPFGSQLYAHEYEEHGVAVIMPKDIVDGRIALSGAAKVNPQTADRLKKHRLRAGDIVFSRRGDVARTVLITEETEGSLCGTGCLRARPCPSHNARYIAYQLQLNQLRVWLEQNAVGQTMPNLNTAILSRLPIQVGRSRSDEDAAVAMLNTWDCAIDAMNRLVRNIEAQNKALAEKLLGPSCRSGSRAAWVLSSLGDVADIYDGTHMTPEYTQQGVPFFSVEHVTQNDFHNTKFISREVFQEESKRVRIEKGDVLMTRIGDIGTPKYIDWDIEASFYVSLALIKPKAPLDGNFLSYYIRTREFQRELHHRTIHVAFPKKINLGEIGECLVAFPSLDEQKRLTRILSTAALEISKVIRQSELLKKEKSALMQQLLTGKRRVKAKDSAAPVAVNG